MKTPLFTLLLCKAFCSCSAETPSIVLNQSGFYPNSSKIAVVLHAPASEQFYLIDYKTNDTVYQSKLQSPVKSIYSSTVTRVADFSVFQKNGTFVLYVKGISTSHPFQIRKNVFKEVSVASLKSFYYQRSNIELEERYAGKWKRPAGHPDTNVLIHASAATAQKPAGTILASPGGWYDAGDYNKYIVNSGITMGTILSAY